MWNVKYKEIRKIPINNFSAFENYVEINDVNYVLMIKFVL